MRKLLFCTLLISMILLLIYATGEEMAQYKAYTAKKIQIYRNSEGIEKIAWIAEDKLVDVFEYGESWCKIGFEGLDGWCETNKLWGFRSLNAGEYKVPGAIENIGLITLSQNTWIESDDFDGVMAMPGTLICVLNRNEEEYILPIWRSVGKLSIDNGNIHPFVSWESARHGDLIGGFTTFYDLEYGGRLAKERAFNVNLGCQRIDKQVIMSGEQFSFNAICGPYKKENGYLLAPNISNSGTGYGGGVCQVTTTLYNAILALPLQIDTWSVHQRSGVPYIPQYFDAAVGTRPDLIFTNLLPYPIRLFASDQQGIVTVLIFRMEADNNEF